MSLNTFLRKITSNAKFLVLILLFSGVFSCLSKRPESSVSIDSGLLIKESYQNKVSGVVSVGGCTATLVSTNTLLFAAHCVYSLGLQADGRINGQVCIQNAPYVGKCSSKLYASPQVYQNWGADIAVAIFDGAPFQHIFPIETNASDVSPGRPVTLVGYSAVNLTTGGFGSKRWGNNKIFGLRPEEYNSIKTMYSGNSDGVAVEPGDSGGPMFAGCRVVGVTSRHSTSGDQQSYHTNVTSEINKTWFKSMEANGAHFCTADSTDTTNCPAQYMYTELTDPPKEADGQVSFPCAVGGTPDPSINVYVRAATKGTPAPEDHVIYFATGLGAKTYGYCQNMSAEECKPDATGSFHPLDAMGQRIGKKVYKIGGAKITGVAAVGANVDYWTFVAYDAQNKLLGSRSISFIKKN